MAARGICWFLLGVILLAGMPVSAADELNVLEGFKEKLARVSESELRAPHPARIALADSLQREFEELLDQGFSYQALSAEPAERQKYFSYLVSNIQCVLAHLKRENLEAPGSCTDSSPAVN